MCAQTDLVWTWGKTKKNIFGVRIYLRELKRISLEQEYILKKTKKNISQVKIYLPENLKEYLSSKNIFARKLKGISLK